MQKLKILNTREVKKIKEKLKEQFGFSDKLDHAFLLNEKGRLFVVNRDISRIDLKKLRVDKYGLYFGELGDELRLSMEGAWLVGGKAEKNIVELNEEEIRKYFLGEDLEKDLNISPRSARTNASSPLPQLKHGVSHPDKSRWVLLKFGKEVISCAKYKDKKILNFLPKIHRSKDLII